MITHHTSCQQCRTVSNSVNSVNSYSAVLPPSPMVFLINKVDEALTFTKCSKWERRKELLVSPQRGRYASPVGNRKMQSLSEIVRNGLREIVGNSL